MTSSIYKYNVWFKLQTVVPMTLTNMNHCRKLLDHSTSNLSN